MKTSRKILITGSAIVLLGLLSVIVLARVLVTPERVKQVLLPRVEQALNRQVTVDDVEIRFFSGIALNKAVIREPEEETVFLSAERMNLRYRFWPLFRMRVEIDEIFIDGPQIRLVRHRDGTFNFSDLIQTADKPQNDPLSDEPAEKAESDNGGGIALLVSQLVLRSGSVHLTDFQTDGSPEHYHLEDVSLQIRQFSPDRDFPLQLAAVFNEAPLSLKGRANLREMAVDLEIILSGLDVMPLVPQFQERIPGRLHRGTLDANLQLSGSLRQLSSEGSLVVNNLGLRLDALPDVPVDDAQVSFEYRMQYDRDVPRLRIDHGRLAFNDVPVFLDGEVQLAEPVALALTLRLNELEVARSLAALPKELVGDLAALEPSGVVTARIHLAGTLDNPQELLRDGELRLDNLQARVGELRPELKGLLTLRGDSLFSENLVLNIGESLLHLQCEAHSLMSRPLEAVVNVRSDQLLLDPLLPAGRKVSAPDPKVDSPAGPDDQKGKPMDLPLILSGAVRINRVVHRGLSIDEVTARYLLRNNLLQLQEVTGKVAGGSFTTNASIDLGKPGYVYRGQLTTRGVQADPLVSAFAPKARGTVFGILNLDLDLAGQGTDIAVIRDHLTGKGEALLQEGRLAQNDLVRGLASYLGLPELSVMGFDRALGRFAVDQGRVDLTSTFVSQDLRMAPQGDIGLDGSLNLNLDLRLSPELTQKLDRSGRFAQLFVDSEGWGQVPLKIKGTMIRPNYALDSAAVVEALRQRASQTLQQTLEKEFLKRDPAAEEEDKERKEKRLLDGVIRGLFGQ